MTQEAWIGALVGVLGLGDHGAWLIPGVGAVGEAGEEPLPLAGGLALGGGLIHEGLGQCQQAGILGQAHDVVHAVALAPAEHLPAAEARVAAEDDLHVRPHLAEALHQQGQDGPGVPGRVDVGGAQIGHQQLAAAEDVEGQEAVLVVVAVEEAADLVTVDGIVGGVEVQDQFLGGRVVGGDEGLHDNLGHRDERGALGAVLQAAQGGGAGQGQIVFDAAFGDQLHKGIVAEGLLVVEVFVAQGQGVDALPEEGALLVDDEEGVPGVGDDAVEGGGESEASVGLAEEQSPGVAGEGAAGEVGLDPVAAEI